MADHSKATGLLWRNNGGLENYKHSPCFEVWLLDHVQVCPSSYTLTPDVESATAKAGIVGGNRNKYIKTELIDREQLDAAMHNATRHNTVGNSQGRNRLTPNHEQEYAPLNRDTENNRDAATGFRLNSTASKSSQV